MRAREGTRRVCRCPAPDAIEARAGSLDDVALAVRHVRNDIAPEGGDPTRLYVVGHSAGGLFAALLGLEPEHLAKAGVPPGSVRGFAMLSGPYDLGRLISFSGAALADEIRASAAGEDLQRYSPERRLRPGPPPMLLLVGGDEDASMIAEQRSMAAALRQVGGDVTAAEIPGASHMGLVMDLSRPGDRTLSALLDFIERHR